jgi:hypothetical protein
MKSRINRSLYIGIALAAVAAVHAQAQTLTADVPFSFHMGSNAMPQGAYRIAATSTQTIAWMTQMDGNGAAAISTFTVVGKTSEALPRLVFRRYGADYFLAEIWSGDASLGLAIPPSTREKELARNGAAPTLAMIRLALRK